MSKKLRIPLITIALTAVMAFAPVLPAFASVQDGVNAARGSEQPQSLIGNSGVFSQITNVLLFIIGAIAVVMIVIGGLRYVVSGGDSKQVQAAKNTILYAIVGVVVAILAYAAVNFVSGTFLTGTTNNSSTINSDTTSGSSVK